jgi:uncharacterized membrane protein
MRRGLPKLIGRPDPWFSSLRWWQKALFGLAAFVVFMALFLLPRNFSIDLVVSVLAVTFAMTSLSVKRWQRFLSLKGWQKFTLIVLSSAALTALLLLTEHTAPYAAVAVVAVALVFSFLTGWRDSGPPPGDRPLGK